MVLLAAGRPVFAIVVEVQLKRDEAKRATWPLYLASLRSRVQCPTALLVVAPDRPVARWAAQPIELGHPGFVLRPLVLGPSALEVTADPVRIAAEPELGVLAVMAGDGRYSAEAALVTLGCSEALMGIGPVSTLTW